MYSSDKGGALWLIHFISRIRQYVSSLVVYWLLLFLRPIHSAYVCFLQGIYCMLCFTLQLWQWYSVIGRHFLYAKIWFGSDQTHHMFIYPALTWLYTVCHFAWQSLQAIHHGTRLHDFRQRLFLIHKSQKDQFKIYEQSVLQQPVISVTVGQWRHGATERKVLPPLIYRKTHIHKYTHAHAHRAKRRSLWWVF